MPKKELIGHEGPKEVIPKPAPIEREISIALNCSGCKKGNTNPDLLTLRQFTILALHYEVTGSLICPFCGEQMQHLKAEATLLYPKSEDIV